MLYDVYKRFRKIWEPNLSCIHLKVKSNKIITNRTMSQNWKTPVIVAVLTASVIGALIWRKKKRTFVKVGKISKLYFFPVKSLKGVEVKKGKCTKLGFELIYVDGVDAVDCGEEAASFFQSYLNKSDVRLVRHFPTVSQRTYLKKNPFESKLRKENLLVFQDLTPFHVMCQSSVDDLDSKVEGKKITFLNFRPNILIEGPKAYAEDSWRYIKFSTGVMINNLTLVTRCLMTTNDPNTGILAKTEPLVTLRKYRIPKDPVIVKNIGSLPCLGIGCGISKEGEISVGDDVLADIGPQPEIFTIICVTKPIRIDLHWFDKSTTGRIPRSDEPNPPTLNEVNEAEPALEPSSAPEALPSAPKVTRSHRPLAGVHSLGVTPKCALWNGDFHFQASSPGRGLLIRSLNDTFCPPNAPL
ncbi:mitochondrial amidoxime-reducing component 1 [Caerostris extrusa]|uniref:Mitochondrial amidoxime-reducing component 1 n=1 Tax=Caerostris extrusa TaxID=172846 RepID=A0AAV4RC77_CAEEX|nr:mitochondrial amidoxime-reducing component 1 [Caerostris extrusa]